MPRIKLSPTLALAFASVIALSGTLNAATDSQAKKHAVPSGQGSARKDAAKPGKAAGKSAAGSRATASHGGKRAARTAAKKTASERESASSAAGLPLPRPRPHGLPSSVMMLASADTQPVVTQPSISAPITTTTTPGDLAAVRQALDLINKGKISAVADVKQSISAPAALKLIEWCYLRSPNSEAGFDRYAAFIRANPSWPSVGMLQKRAEGALWEDKRDAATVRAYFADGEPKSGKGRLALARALLAQGDLAGAQHYAREAWRRDSLTPDTEQQALDTFGNMFTTADHRARMHRMLFAREDAAAMRAANRLGAADQAVAKARIALDEKAENAGALIDAVPAEARNDPNFVFARIQWLRRKDKIAEAA